MKSHWICVFLGRFSARRSRFESRRNSCAIWWYRGQEWTRICARENARMNACIDAGKNARTYARSNVICCKHMPDRMSVLLFIWIQAPPEKMLNHLKSYPKHVLRKYQWIHRAFFSFWHSIQHFVLYLCFIGYIHSCLVPEKPSEVFGSIGYVWIYVYTYHQWHTYIYIINYISYVYIYIYMIYINISWITYMYICIHH